MFIPFLDLVFITASSKVQNLFLQCNTMKSQSYSSKAFYPVLEKKKKKQLLDVNCFNNMDWFIDYMIAIKLTKLYVTNFKISTVSFSTLQETSDPTLEAELKIRSLEDI